MEVLFIPQRYLARALAKIQQKMVCQASSELLSSPLYLDKNSQRHSNKHHAWGAASLHGRVTWENNKQKKGLDT
jgi:hypothetical protein